MNADSRETDLPEIDRPRTGRPVSGRRGERRGHSKIRRWLAHPEPARDIEIDIGRIQPQPAAGLEHREEHRKPSAVPADH